MKVLLNIFTIGLIAQIAIGQNNTSKNLGLIHHSINDKNLGRIDFYLTDSLHSQKKPLLLFLDGSGNNSLFTYKSNEKNTHLLYSSIPINYKKASVKYHVVFISKPNVPLIDTLIQNDTNPNIEYDRLLSADWRVSSASLVINYIMKNYAVDKTKVVAMGYSEGGQVSPRLALYNKKITHCIAFVGGGLNQFFDEIIATRLSAQKGEISQQKAQENIDSLYQYLNRIYANPYSTNNSWYGHTYLRWSSFCLQPNLEFLTKLEIPIYIAQGTNDENTSVLSSDYIRLEFLRLGKNNLTQKIYPDCDHFFNKAIIENKTTRYENILDKVMNEAFIWLDQK